MQIRKLFAVSAIFFCALAPKAQAADTDNLFIAGAAIHNELRKDYYVGVLLTGNTGASADELLNSDLAHRLDMLITHKSLSSRRFASVWSTRIAINNMAYTDQLTAMADDVIAFTSVVKDRVFQGDRVSIANSPEADALIVSINGVELQRFDRSLYPMLLRAWIGSTPPSTEYKQGILSKGDIAPALVDQINNWSVSGEQVARIEAWKGPTPEEIAALEAQQKAEEEAEAQRLAKLEADAKKKEAARIAAAKEKARKAAAAKAAAAQLLLAEEEEDEDLLDAADEFAAQLYRSQLLKWTYKYVRYPKRALERDQEGTVVYEVTIDRDGNVIKADEKAASEHSTLNSETGRAIERAEPYPAMPADVKGEQFTFEMPIKFTIPD